MKSGTGGSQCSLISHQTITPTTRRSSHRQLNTEYHSVARLMFLDVFLFEAEGFGGVEDEHFHADVFGDFGAGKLRDDDHERDREGDGPDGGLLAEDSDERMGDPEILEIHQAEIAEAGE